MKVRKADPDQQSVLLHLLASLQAAHDWHTTLLKQEFEIKRP